MPYPSHAYLVYVDDSGNEDVGTLWTGLGLPFEQWTEYLRRWLGFRKWLYRKYEVPASFELHAQAWLAVEPAKATPEDQLHLAHDSAGILLDVLQRGRDRRRARFEIFEKGLKTIGGFTDARIFTVHASDHEGPAKTALYDELLCFIEEFLRHERAYGTLMVDGVGDGGGHFRAAHRALRIIERRIIEDAGRRRSSDSQLLQMTDWCAHAALQSIQEKPGLDPKFWRQYETRLDRLIVRPFGQEDGRCIRGFDYAADLAQCPSQRVSEPR